MDTAFENVMSHHLMTLLVLKDHTPWYVRSTLLNPYFLMQKYDFFHRKTINNAYEEYVLSVGDFDERIFLDNDADEEIGTPAKSREDATGELSERIYTRNNNLQQHLEQVSFSCRVQR